MDFHNCVIDVLRHLPALEMLVLVGNEIGDDGAAALASVLQHLPRLQKLHLNFNQINDTGLISFPQLGLTLPPLPASLECIDLTDNIGQPDMHKLTQQNSVDVLVSNSRSICRSFDAYLHFLFIPTIVRVPGRAERAISLFVMFASHFLRSQ